MRRQSDHGAALLEDHFENMRINVGDYQHTAHLHLKLHLKPDTFRDRTATDSRFQALVAAQSAADGLPNDSVVEQDAEWRQISKVPTQLLLDAMFHSIDSDSNGKLTRKEVRLSAFGDLVGQHWNALDENSDMSVSKEEWNLFFADFLTRHGLAKYKDFTIEMAWSAGLDVEDLQPRAPIRRWRRMAPPGGYLSGLPTQVT
jgi:hypothetical protein